MFHEVFKKFRDSLIGSARCSTSRTSSISWWAAGECNRLRRIGWCILNSCSNIVNDWRFELSDLRAIFCCWLHRQIRMLPRTLSQWTMLVWAMFTISRLQETHSRTCCSIVREGTSCLSSRSSDKSNGVLIRFQLAFITFQHTIHAEECAEERNRYEIDLRSIRWGELWK